MKNFKELAKRMNNFKDLKEPQHGLAGWYIATKNGTVAWLTVEGIITRDTSIDAIDLIYHDDEQAALQAAHDYYNKCGFAYPLIDKIQELQKNEQQVMKFK